MKTTKKQAKNSRFQKGSGSFNCTICNRSTRSTGNGDNENLKQCVECYEIAGIENLILDTPKSDVEKIEKLNAEIKQLEKQRDAKIADAKRKKASTASGKAVTASAAATKTSKPSQKSSKSAKASPAETTFQTEEFKQKMSELVKARGGFKRQDKKTFNKLTDPAKVTVVAKRHYHKLKKDAKPDAWKRAVAAARKELGIK